MASYEFLLIDNPKLGTVGKPVARMAAGHTWGKMEGPPDFRVVSVSCSDEQRDYLMEHATYDTSVERFVSTEDGNPVVFSVDVITGVKPTNDEQRLQEVAAELAGTPVADPIAFFKLPFPYEDDPEGYRKKWIKAAFAFRDDAAVKAFIACVKGQSCFGTIRDRLLAIPLKTRAEFRASKYLDQADIDWMEQTLKVPLR